MSELADAFVSYTVRMSGASREVRMELLYSPLEGLWSEVLGIFVSAEPEAGVLLLLIIDRMGDHPAVAKLLEVSRPAVGYLGLDPI